jgi:hypothetical protein
LFWDHWGNTENSLWRGQQGVLGITLFNPKMAEKDSNWGSG